MLELLALLLPLAAASGWYAAKRHYSRKYFLDHARPLTQAYCRGLNYLLDEKTDKAIDIFAHILEKDHGAVETHIALGNLFRRRGEVEKAIDIHERLINGFGLNEIQKAHACFELGMDYMRAGLFDRAETIFQALSETELHRKASLQQLLQIYQQEKDWRKAIGCTQKLLRFAKTPRGENVAQFFCELAENAVVLCRFDEARDYLAQALREDSRCVRASLIKARLDMESGAYSDALHALRKVEFQAPAYLPEILQPLGICYERLGREQEFIDFLESLNRKCGLVAAAVHLAERLRVTEGSAAAVEYLLAVLDKQPCLWGLGSAIGLLAMPDGPGEESVLLSKVYRIVSRLVAEIPRYRCSECGFSGSELHWRCPSCQSWASMAP